MANKHRRETSDKSLPLGTVSVWWNKLTMLSSICSTLLRNCWGPVGFDMCTYSELPRCWHLNHRFKWDRPIIWRILMRSEDFLRSKTSSSRMGPKVLHVQRLSWSAATEATAGGIFSKAPANDIFWQRCKQLPPTPFHTFPLKSFLSMWIWAILSPKQSKIVLHKSSQMTELTPTSFS